MKKLHLVKPDAAPRGDSSYIVIYIDWMTTTTQGQGRNDPQKILFAAFQVFDFAGMVESVEEEMTVSGRPPQTRTST